MIYSFLGDFLSPSHTRRFHQQSVDFFPVLHHFLSFIFFPFAIFKKFLSYVCVRSFVFFRVAYSRHCLGECNALNHAKPMKYDDDTEKKIGKQTRKKNDVSNSSKQKENDGGNKNCQAAMMVKRARESLAKSGAHWDI